MRPAMQVELPEPLLEDVYRATQVHCLTAARNEAQGRRVRPLDRLRHVRPAGHRGPARDPGHGSRGPRGIRRRSLEFFISSYNADGLLVKGYTLMGTGPHLGRSPSTTRCARPPLAGRDRARDPQVLPVDRPADGEDETADACGQRLPEFGLVPPGVLADWNRYAYYFYANAHFCAGLEAAGRMLAAVRPAEAQEIRAVPPRSTARTSCGRSAGSEGRCRSCGFATALGSLRALQASTATA